METNRALWRNAGAGMAATCLLVHLLGGPGMAEERSSTDDGTAGAELVSFVVDFARSGLTAESFADRSQRELRELVQVTVGEPEARPVTPAAIMVSGSGLLFKVPRNQLAGMAVVTLFLGRSHGAAVQFHSENLWRSGSYGVEATTCAAYSKRNITLALREDRYESECFPAHRPSGSRAIAIRKLLEELGEDPARVRAFCPATAGCTGGAASGCDVEGITSAAGTDDIALTLETHGCAPGQHHYVVTGERGRPGTILRYSLRCGCVGRW